MLHESNSILAYSFVIIMFTITGIPPILCFLSSLISSMNFIACISIVTSVISTFYYIRILKVIFFEKLYLIPNNFFSNSYYFDSLYTKYNTWYIKINSFTDIEMFGKILYTHFVLQFLIISFILFLVLVGVVYLSSNPTNKKLKIQSMFYKIFSIYAFFILFGVLIFIFKSKTTIIVVLSFDKMNLFIGSILNNPYGFCFHTMGEQLLYDHYFLELITIGVVALSTTFILSSVASSGSGYVASTGPDLEAIPMELSSSDSEYSGTTTSTMRYVLDTLARERQEPVLVSARIIPEPARPMEVIFVDNSLVEPAIEGPMPTETRPYVLPQPPQEAVAQPVNAELVEPVLPIDIHFEDDGLTERLHFAENRLLDAQNELSELQDFLESRLQEGNDTSRNLP